MAGNMLSERVRENIRYDMPWQLEEELAKAEISGNLGWIAYVGMKALAFEQLTVFEDKFLDYGKVWSRAFDSFNDITGQQG